MQYELINPSDPYTFLAEKSYGWVRCFNQGAFVITNGKNVTYQLKEECNNLDDNMMPFR